MSWHRKTFWLKSTIIKLIMSDLLAVAGVILLHLLVYNRKIWWFWSITFWFPYLYLYYERIVMLWQQESVSMLYCVESNSSTTLRNPKKKKKDTRVLNCKISQDPLWEANNSLSQTPTPRPWGRCCYKSREPHFHACTAARDRRVGASQSHYRAPKPQPNEKRND